ncbi:T9SS type A sorting domain-containing protein [Pedobacter sp. UBA4863]|uniref:T9SS type A sorting domain-containing protein n=1 Tax=Pedobacter sp. UBA4863 TaxID=1947060 RepID=UPI0025F34B34|nr:T9SS type A sorting domain-containing protein [Pedobacter sp. UBA4863]
MKTKITLTFIVILCALFGAIAQTPGTGNILYVNVGIIGGNGSGDSWENAIPQLADALKYAKQQNNYTSGNPLKIYVAKGTYTPLYSPVDGENLGTPPTDARSAAFLLVKNVQLYGGFDPASGNTNINTRILPSTGGGSVLSGDIDNNSILDNGNAYHVVIAVGDLDAALIDGFNVNDGYADNSTDFPMINNEFIYLDSGAGMLVSGLLTFSNEQAKVAINQCSFSNNYATYVGGAMFSQLATVDVQNSSFQNNTCATDAGGMYNTASDLTITNCTFDGNLAIAGRGGAIFNDGASVIATNTILSNNKAGTEGAGLYNSSAPTVQLSNCTIKGNQAVANGGGVYSNGSGLTLNNTAITNNTATNKGGGFYFDSGLQIPVFTNVTIANNNAVNGSAVYVNSESLILQYRNAIVFGDVDPNYNAQYSLIEGSNNTANNNLDATGITLTNIFNNPTAGDYTLLYNSIAINAGNNTLFTGLDVNTKDLSGNPRIYNGGIIDLGSYEYQGNLAVLPVTLVNFTAHADGNKTKLQWQTINEVNNKQFTVYRSGDEGKFVRLREVNGSSGSSYGYVDYSPLTGNNYYKLAQIDNDGKTTDLGVRMVSFSLSAFSLQLYPNPTENELNVSFYAGSFYILEVVNLSGKVFQSNSISPSDHSKKISLINYPTGVYFIRLIGKENIENKKIIKR